jgi:hypothetical protein
MIRRDGESNFVDSLIMSKRGNVFLKKASVAKTSAVESTEDAKKLLNKFDKSEDIPDDYIQEHHDRLEKGDDHKEVVKDFFQGLHEVKSSKLSIKTAKLYRQHGLFKKAERDVYQNAETGDFWKISEDKKYVVRMFKEVDGTVAN